MLECQRSIDGEEVIGVQELVELWEGWIVGCVRYLRNKVKQGHDDDRIQLLLNPAQAICRMLDWN